MQIDLYQLITLARYIDTLLSIMYLYTATDQQRYIIKIK